MFWLYDWNVAQIGEQRLFIVKYNKIINLLCWLRFMKSTKRFLWSSELRGWGKPSISSLKSHGWWAEWKKGKSLEKEGCILVGKWTRTVFGGEPFQNKPFAGGGQRPHFSSNMVIVEFKNIARCHRRREK